MLCYLAGKWYIFSHNWIYVQKIVSEYVLHIDMNFWSQKSGPNNCICTHNTPHSNHNITSWHSMDYNVVLCRPVPVKKSGLKPGFITIHNVCVSISPTYNPWRYQFTKFSFILHSASWSWGTSCIIWLQVQFCCILWWGHKDPHLLCSSCQMVYWRSVS